MSYAKGTTVGAGQTRGEIEDLLTRHGATRFATMNDGKTYTMAFEIDKIAYKIDLPLPDPESDEFWLYKRGSVVYRREEAAGRKNYQDELNRRWRALGAVIKAKVIAVNEGISTIEREFLGNVMLPGGQTIADTYAHRLHDLAQAGHIPALTMGGDR